MSDSSVTSSETGAGRAGSVRRIPSSLSKAWRRISSRVCSSTLAARLAGERFARLQRFDFEVKDFGAGFEPIQHASRAVNLDFAPGPVRAFGRRTRFERGGGLAGREGKALKGACFATQYVRLRGHIG